MGDNKTNSNEFKLPSFPEGVGVVHYPTEVAGVMINEGKEDQSIIIETVTRYVQKINGFSDFAKTVIPHIGAQTPVNARFNKEDLTNTFEKWFRHFNNWDQYLKHTHPAIDQWWSNLQRLFSNVTNHYTIDTVKDNLNGKRVLFCGAGPSLKKNWKHVLKVIKDGTAVVVAGGSAIRYFSEQGVKPHLCIAIDPYPTEWTTVFKHIDREWTRDIPLWTNLSLEDKCLNEWEGPMIINGGLQCCAATSEIDQLPSIRDGHIGVSTSMLEIARFAKPSEVHFVGVDLALGKEGEEYADGRTPEHLNKQLTHDDGTKTAEKWIAEKYWIEQTIKELHGIVWGRFKTDHGLKINGMRYINPKRWDKIEGGCKFDLTDERVIRYSLEELEAMKEKLGKWIEELGHLDSYYTKYKEPPLDELNKSDIFKLWVLPWAEVQYGRKIKTREYNFPLMHWVCESAKELLEQAKIFAEIYASISLREQHVPCSIDEEFYKDGL